MNIRGQHIVLRGVKAPAAPGSVKLNTSAADRILAGMPYVHRVMAPKNLKNIDGGGVSGNCQVSGEPFILKGVQPFTLRVETFNGKPVLSQANTLYQASLAFQPGSGRKSYTAVMVVSVADPTDRVNFMMSYTDETPIATVLRYDITTDSPDQKKLVAYGSNNNPAHASVQRPAGNFAVVVVDYNDATRVVSIAVNQAEAFVEQVKSVNHPVVADKSYFEIGYHGSVNSLRAAKVGDVYLFEESLRTSPAAMAELVKLVAALKTEYAIA
ncbi:hypothetical protein [Pseudomonas kurunegalensis]|uniref:hypothetical protein n=1 Tax=Pseudomonas kurunegalensis TaxID=485880 RepID=UPI00256FDC96|nr:hypothetical protein [Pseudomonas kurunegalensis]WJD60886.1 hypothetical protein QQ992_18315 [Pseudomonas kurunegalensis]